MLGTTFFVSIRVSLSIMVFLQWYVQKTYLRKMHFTVDMEDIFGVSQSFWNSAAVAIGFFFESRINLLFFLSSERRGRPDLGKSFTWPYVTELFQILWTADLVILILLATALRENPFCNPKTTSSLIFKLILTIPI